MLTITRQGTTIRRESIWRVCLGLFDVDEAHDENGDGPSVATHAL